MNKTILSPTPFGPVTIVWLPWRGRPRIVRVVLSTREVSADEAASGLFRDLETASCAEIDAVKRDMEALLKGRTVRFSLGIARLDLCPPFQQAVLRAEHEIPRGRVSTYRLIAARLGKPHAARAVGNALATNPFPLIVPCHRAIRSDGHLGGYQGGLDMKRALLQAEGVDFDGKDRVSITRFHYEEAGR